MSENWKIRDSIPSDIPFIYSTWLNSYRYDSDLGRSCKNSGFYPAYTKVLDDILMQPGTKIRVACMNEDDFVIFGYGVFGYGQNEREPQFIIHYLFVKPDFRLKGIANSLMKDQGWNVLTINQWRPTITHKTDIIKPMLEKQPGFNYSPYEICFKKKEMQHG